MELEKLMALLDKVGDNRIIGFIMDNASRVYYRNNMLFNRKVHLDMETECIKVIDVDNNDNEYICYKPISTIQSVLVSDVAGEISKYNTRYIGG